MAVGKVEAQRTKLMSKALILTEKRRTGWRENSFTPQISINTTNFQSFCQEEILSWNGVDGVGKF